jgi:chaperonin GroES
MNFTPLYDRVLVKRLEEDTKTTGGIIIPDTAKEKPLKAKVLKVGKGRMAEDGTLRALDVREGNTVLIGKYSGTEIKIEGVEHTVLREEDILGVVEG